MVSYVVFVNSLVFLVIIYSNIKFTTVKYVEKRMTSNLSKSL